MHERPLYYVFALFVALMVINLISPAFGDGEISVESTVTFDISANKTFFDVSSPVSVNFTADIHDGSPGYPDEINWTLLDKNGIYATSTKIPYTSDNWTQIISHPGLYGVTCIAYNSTGTPGESWNSNPRPLGYITAYKPVSANFTNITPTTGVLPLDVTFYSDNFTGGPNKWYWESGALKTDGVNRNGTLRFPTATTYTIKHTVWNTTYDSPLVQYQYKNGWVNNSTSSIYQIIGKEAIVANFTAKYGTTVVPFTGQVKGPVPLALQFFDNSTGSDINGRNWSFGDNSPYNLNTHPTYTYTTPGIFDVTLNVSSPWDFNNTTQKRYVNAYLPLDAGFTYTNKTDSCNRPVFPVTYYFSANDTKTGNSIPTAWNWSFGDKTVNDTRQNPDHRFNLPGIYDVILTTYNETHDINQSEMQQVLVSGLYANFTADPEKGFQTETNQPIKVNFTYNATDVFDAASIHWDFGNGDSTGKEDQTVSSIYTRPGNYTVNLTVGNTCNQYNSTERVISIIERPVPNFTYQPSYGKFPLNVQFTDTSTDSPNQWEWDFGDSSYHSDKKDPVHQYAAPGSYDVTLWVKNTTIVPIMSWRGTTKSIILSEGFDTKFEAEPVRGGWPLKVQFTDKTEPALVNNWTWDFGDNLHGSDEQNPNYTYSDAGNFIVNLTVRNTTTQATGSYQSTIEVVDPIYANFKPNQTYVYMNKTTGVLFESLSVGNVTEYFWDFGDESQIETDPTVVHIFPEFKEYQVNLTVANDYYNLTNTTGFLLNITPQEYPYIDFVVNPPRADKMEPVSFTVTEIGGTNVSTPVWNFGDGSPEVTGIKPTHQFQKSGIFNVTATVTGDYGPAVSKTHPASIRGLDPDFIIVPPGGWATVNTNVTFMDNSVGNPEKWAWDFGDNTIIEQTYDNFVVHKFEKEGLYNITMKATNWEPVEDSITKQLTIINKTVPQGVDFNIPEQKYSGNHPLYVQFEDTTPAQANVVEWLWEFGDGTNSFEKEPNHTYQKPGQYTVILTVRNDAGTNEKRRVAYVVVL
ncbi:PKD domain-containing protein [Methanospirillum stamsii]|uniref:PKD domain-containing protein n=1 Tax=Methanospirillum stamsii TaxID=1277351 RepID=A0A2V2MYT3_9EURY|nr:PKD domain-containing protein [Methanospirillum stamsii]PWR73304.1 hypothetical protein DLD82_10555 [Methanospirillum stamsii]